MAIYCLVVTFAVWQMALAPMQLSEPGHPNYWIFEKRLSQGWLFGRKVDNTDGQFRQFRNGLPSLLGLACAYLLASTAYRTYCNRSASVIRSSTPTSPNAETARQRMSFLVVASLSILFLLHGVSAFKILAILYVNYQIPSRLGASRITPFAVWTFNVGVMFANEIFDGYKFGRILPVLSLLDDGRIAGLMPRWHVMFNISMLRLISFSIDWYWAQKDAGNSTSDPGSHDFSPRNYLAYVLYPPLYIAGPIVTFTSFVDQVKRQTTVSKKAIMAYAVRFLACWLTMEVILHYMYVVAIKDSYAIYRDAAGKETRSPAWKGDTPFELAMISFWNLVIVWLKLLLPWRFFRLWSLMDGIDPPENMIRCVLNNYSTRGFWRSWHRSYNLWLLRYLYVPIGGAANTLLATLVVFTFVALWHDLSLKLLTWGWAITLFVLPEVAAAKLLPESQYGDRPWYIHACAVGAVFNIVMMIVANIVGFVLGPENSLAVLGEVFGTWSGVFFAIQASVVLFCAAHVMFEYREEELRRGIVRKC